MAWDASSDTSVTDYIVHYGVRSRVYSRAASSSGQTSLSIDGLQDGVTYYFAAKGRALPARTLAILYVALRRWRQRVRLADHHQRLDEPDLRRDRLEQARPVQDEAPSRRFHQHLFNPRPHYTPPTLVTNGVLDLPDADVVFSGGNLSTTFTNGIQWNGWNAFRNLSNHKISLSFSASSGRFRGSVENPANGKSASFSGVVLQNQNFAAGFLGGTNRSTRVLISQPPN